jgi:hypothetical protein
MVTAEGYKVSLTGRLESFRPQGVRLDYASKNPLKPKNGLSGPPVLGRDLLLCRGLDSFNPLFSEDKNPASSADARKLTRVRKIRLVLSHCLDSIIPSTGKVPPCPGRQLLHAVPQVKLWGCDVRAPLCRRLLKSACQ